MSALEADVAQATCEAKHPTNSSVIPCDLEPGHDGDHHSWSGCAGSHMTWPADLRESWSAGIDRILAIVCADCGTKDDLVQTVTGNWICRDCRDGAAYDAKGDRR